MPAVHLAAAEHDGMDGGASVQLDHKLHLSALDGGMTVTQSAIMMIPGTHAASAARSLESYVGFPFSPDRVPLGDQQICCWGVALSL